MDVDDDKGIDSNDMWEWKEGDFLLKENPSSDISPCLWDEMNQSEDSLMFMLNEQTPIKDCADFDYKIANNGDYASNLLEECIDSSQQKRRRMLHFPVDSNENGITNMPFSSIFLKAKEREDEQMDEEPSPSINVEWTSQCHLGFFDGTCTLNSEDWEQASEGWLDNCLEDRMIKDGTDETTAPEQDLSCDEAYKQQVDIKESNSFAAEMETDLVQDNWPIPVCKILKGRRSMIETSAKLTTSVAYPFALVKPCGVEGDLTLKDINRRLHTPPLKSKHIQGDNHSLSCHTSAFSGKQVVVKTKIRTEGGKGSITIMRTKG